MLKRQLILALCACGFALSGCKASAPSLPAPAPTPEIAAPEAPAPVVADVPTTSAAPAATGDAVAGDPIAPEQAALPQQCLKLLTCCDAWVKQTPSARVGCDAQRHAFRAAKTPEDKAKLADLCEQALAAWGQLTDIPAICR